MTTTTSTTTTTIVASNVRVSNSPFNSSTSNSSLLEQQQDQQQFMAATNFHHDMTNSFTTSCSNVSENDDQFYDTLSSILSLNNNNNNNHYYHQFNRISNDDDNNDDNNSTGQGETSNSNDYTNNKSNTKQQQQQQLIHYDIQSGASTSTRTTTTTIESPQEMDNTDYDGGDTDSFLQKITISQLDLNDTLETSCLSDDATNKQSTLEPEPVVVPCLANHLRITATRDDTIINVSTPASRTNSNTIDSNQQHQRQHQQQHQQQQQLVLLDVSKITASIVSFVDHPVLLNRLYLKSSLLIPPAASAAAAAAAAVREVASTSFRRLYYTARSTYSLATWTKQYSETGNTAAGYNLKIYPDSLCNFTNDIDADGDIASNSTNNKSQLIQNQQRIDNLPRFSRLSWTERQLVQEWRSCSVTTNVPDIQQDNTIESNCVKKGKVLVDDIVVDDFDDDFDNARIHVPSPLQRPQWTKSNTCLVCHSTFGPSLLRHHCRLCGISVCNNDSQHTRTLPQLGYHPDIPERVCDTCASIVWEQNLTERIIWRLARCRDYMNSVLAPYFESGCDSVEQKMYRIAEAALTMAKAIPLGAQATIAVETADVIRKYGLVGIYTIMLRQEFLAAADLLRTALGINQTAWPLSVHELSAAIFYALAQHRAMRGINPEHEHNIHSCKSFSNETRQRSTDNLCSDNINLFQPICDMIPDAFISSIIFYAPLALNFIYLEKEVDMQLLAAQQGWRLIYAYLNSERDGANVGSFNNRQSKRDHLIHDRPASAVFVHAVERVVCLVIRGTVTIQDVITDIRQSPVPFPDHPKESSDHLEGNDSILNSHDEWTDVQFVTTSGGLAVDGMASAAFNLYREHSDSLITLARKGFRIRLVGHSLGGSVATLLGLLIHNDLNELRLTDTRKAVTIESVNMDNSELSDPLRVYGYGSPCCVDENLAKAVEAFTVTTVLHDDVVPRLSPIACRGLMKHLLHIRETWVKTHFPDDVRAFRDRAQTMWAPRWRGGFALPSATTSSHRLKWYCRKQVQSSRAQLLSIKKKLDAHDNHHDTSPPLFDNDTYIESTNNVQSQVDNISQLEDEIHSEAVLLEETPLPCMYVPGRIVHVYAHHGVYKASFVPRTFHELRTISMAGNMLSDHKPNSYYDAILEVRSVRRAPENPPSWTGFDEDDKCSCCASNFTWASTCDSKAQEARDKHNCRSCGALVCHPCSKQRVPLPSIGLNILSRVCDRCYYNDIDRSSPPSPTIAVQDDRKLGSNDKTVLSKTTATTKTKDNTSTSSGMSSNDLKPTRIRSKRSAVVDELASRIQSTSI